MGAEGRNARQCDNKYMYWAVNVVWGNLVPRPSTPRFYLAAMEKNRGVRPGISYHVRPPIFLHSCEIKSGRGRPGYEVSLGGVL